MEIPPEMRKALEEAANKIPSLSAISADGGEAGINAMPIPEVNGLFPVVDTERCVLAEMFGGIDNGSFVPSYTYAMEQTMNTYTTSQVAAMYGNSWLDDLTNPAYSGNQDVEYSPGLYMFTGCDAAVRQANPSPYGLDMFPVYLFPAALDPEGDNVCSAGSWSVDSGGNAPSTAKYGGETAYYVEVDNTCDYRWDNGGYECIKPEIDARLLVPSDYTMTVNGTFDDALDEGNISLSISAINDVVTDSGNYVVCIWMVDDYNVIETRNNPFDSGGGAVYTDKDYYIRNSMQKWIGLDDGLDGFLTTRGDTIYYQDIFFDRTVGSPHGGTKAWNGNECGIIATIYDESTMLSLQTVYYPFTGGQPDLTIVPTDIGTTINVVNETVHGPTFAGETGPIWLANGNVINCSLYVDLQAGPGSWIPLQEGADYTLNYATGEIDTSPIEPFDAGWFFHAYYNFTAALPNEGDNVPLDITITNAGMGGTGGNVEVGIYINDPTQGGVLDGTHTIVGGMAAESTYNFIYNWDTTGYQGYNSVCIIPDHGTLIAETNENNNIAFVDVYVSPPDDVGPISIDSHTDGGTYEWGIQDIQATVENFGTNPQVPFNVRCQVFQGVVEVFNQIQSTVANPMNPGETEQLTWNYDFGYIDTYTITITTLLGTDSVPTNDVLSSTITTQNTLPPGPPTHLRIEPPAGGAPTNYTVEADEAGGHGGVAGDWQDVDELPPAPPDGFTEDLTEILIGGDTWANYSVASDILPVVQGTLTNDYTFIDEWPATGDTETITEATVPGGPLVLYDETIPNPDATLGWDGDGDQPQAEPGWVTAQGNGDTNDVRIDNGANPPSGATPSGLPCLAFHDCDEGGTPPNLYDWAWTGNIDLSGQSGCTLDYYWQSDDVDAGEGAWVYYSTDATSGNDPAATYNLIASYINPADDVWTQEIFAIPDVDCVSTFSLTFGSVSSQATETMFFDDITITTTLPGYESLEHRWTTEVIPAGYTNLDLIVRGYSSAPGDDTFSIEYSDVAEAGPYTPTGITIDQGVMTTYAPFTMPLGLSGSIWIRVIDDNSADVATTDVVLDAIDLEWLETVPIQASLEHRWRTENIPGAGTLVLGVIADNPSIDDTFTFGYSAALGGPYAPVLTIPLGGSGEYTGAMIPPLTGNFYINVIDDNAGDATLDTLSVDRIRIEHTPGGVYSADYITIADNPTGEGFVTGAHGLTNPPADSNAQEIQEELFGGGTLFSDDFSSNDFVAGGWTVEPEPGPGGVWNAATGAAVWNLVEAFAFGERAITKGIDTTGFSAVEVTYDWETRDFAAPFYGFAYTQWSDDGGGSWTDIERISVVQGMGTSGPHILPAACDNNPNVQLKFAMDITNAPQNGNDGVTYDNILVAVPTPYTLEHRWTIQNMPVGSLSRTLHVNARTNGGSNDDFIFGYSDDVNGPYTPALTVTDTGGYADYYGSISASISGPLYINVVDSGGEVAGQDSVFVDVIRIEDYIGADPDDATIRWDLSSDDTTEENDVTAYLIDKADSAAGAWYEGPFTLADTVAPGTQVWRDVGEGLDMVDNIWYQVSATDGPFTSTPTGIISKFDVLPVTTNVVADDVSPVLIIPIGTLSITLNASISDNTTTDEWTAPFITGADWYDPLSTDGGAIAAPLDAVWDGPYEAFSEVIPTAAWGAGDHVVEVRGNSPYGWGTVATVTVTVTAPIYDINITGLGWQFVSFPIDASADVLTVFDDAAWGDGQTTWDIIYWYDPTDAADPWKSHNKNWGGTQDMPNPISNHMGFWIHILANGGDGNLTVGAGSDPVGESVTLEAGWNLVGFPTTATDVQAQNTLPNWGVSVTKIGYYNDPSPYDIIETADGTTLMNPGNAYWVYSTIQQPWNL